LTKGVKGRGAAVKEEYGGLWKSGRGGNEETERLGSVFLNGKDYPKQRVLRRCQINTK
jgi:hypothetical protein